MALDHVHDDDDGEARPLRFRFSLREGLHLLVSAAVVTFGMALVLGVRKGEVFEFPTGIESFDLTNLGWYALLSAIAVVPAFFLHELAHKVLALKYGMFAEFQANFFGLAGGLLLTLLAKFLFLVPGAVNIYPPLALDANGHLIEKPVSRRDAGVISIVGPMVNLAIAALFILARLVLQPIPVAGFGDFFELVSFLNLILAAFNMLPIGPLDGRKVMRWSVVWFVLMWVMIVGLFVSTFLGTAGF